MSGSHHGGGGELAACQSGKDQECKRAEDQGVLAAAFIWTRPPKDSTTRAWTVDQWIGVYWPMAPMWRDDESSQRSSGQRANDLVFVA